ncbi:MAG: nadB, partial [Acidobacteria bacterium]|nr:nadB [Acidobacteriota bacterium]
MVSASFDRVLRADAVVVGSGIGGLTAALAMAPLRVVVVTKGDPGGGSTPWAQGGIAAAVARDDSPAEHAADTVAVGGGINDLRAVDVLTDAAPERVAALEALGVRFDTGSDGALLLSREGGHHRRRVLHAGGDSTGAA